MSAPGSPLDWHFAAVRKGIAAIGLLIAISGHDARETAPRDASSGAWYAVRVETTASMANWRGERSG